MMRLASVSQTLVASVGLGLTPPPELSVSNWADTYRVLSREDSASPGRWRTSMRPYQGGIMDAISDPRIERVTVMGAAQWGKTQILGNILGYYIHVDPSPIMVVQPTVEAAEKWSKTRLAPMLRDVPELRSLVSDAKSRESGNTILAKTFPGGLLVIVGSNAPAGLASQPVRILLLDEVDRFDASAGTEGDPVDLAEARTLDFRKRRKIYACSTPGIAEASRIQTAHALGDCRQWQVPCPECGTVQPLRWSQVNWTKGQPATAVYVCSAGCGSTWSQPELSRAVRQGSWVATRETDGRHASFHVPGLVIRSMEHMVEGFEDAQKKGMESMKVWTNTVLGDPWDSRLGDLVQVSALMEQREAWDEVPGAVALITISVDVQDNRLEALAVGWGVGEESWVLEHREIPGNLVEAEPWNQLEAFIRKVWDREDGGAMKASMAVIDLGGHFGKQTYRFARRPRMRGVVRIVKGATKPQIRPVIRSKSKAGLLYLLDTVALKDQLFARLRLSAKPGAEGFGVIHFHESLDEAWFDQLLSEEARVKGLRRVYEKRKAGIRNEALDLMVYASAAFEIAAPKGEMPTRKDVEPADSPDPEQPRAEPVAPKPVQPDALQRPTRPRRVLGNWGSGPGKGW